jgi:predicted transposase/invertase (TIGR01784 family)
MSDEELKDLELARAREKAEFDENSRIKWAKLEGKLEGRLEGKLESKFEIAKQMLLDGLSWLKIAKYTGLTEKEIMGLA